MASSLGQCGFQTEALPRSDERGSLQVLSSGRQEGHPETSHPSAKFASAECHKNLVLRKFIFEQLEPMAVGFKSGLRGKAEDAALEAEIDSDILNSTAENKA